jgi:endonuclease/exonuclease/phosphatase family metal-dependent hydrolase
MKLKHGFIFSLLILLSCQEETQDIGKPNAPDDDDDEPTTEIPVTGKYAECLFVPADGSFDIVTWNIEHFPKENSTIALTAEIIKSMNADVIAVQEIDNDAAFNQLVAALDGWSGKLHDIGQASQGFLYKNSEITSASSLTLLFNGSNDDYAFPRPLVMMTVKHISGKEVSLINVHLKCCGDGEERRQAASEQLKAYIDNNLSDKSVIVLGDYNDDITSPSATNRFQNFISDPDDYKFVDMAIAAGSTDGWSYPSWPSHLDHMLVTNELFSSIDDIEVLKLSTCEPTYSDNVSDHRPVMLQLK